VEGVAVEDVGGSGVGAPPPTVATRLTQPASKQARRSHAANTLGKGKKIDLRMDALSLCSDDSPGTADPGILLIWISISNTCPGTAKAL